MPVRCPDLDPEHHLPESAARPTLPRHPQRVSHRATAARIAPAAGVAPRYAAPNPGRGFLYRGKTLRALPSSPRHGLAAPTSRAHNFLQ